MRERARALDDDVAARRAALEQSNGPGRLFLIEAEYALAMHRAEAAWVRSLLAQIADGTFPDVAGWREFHETGHVPAEFTLMLAAEGGPPTD